MSSIAVVDVVIPVFNQFTITRNCIESVIASRQQNNFEIIVIDDGSSEPNLVEYLRRTEETGSITLIRNSHNLGFTESVNTGMRLHKDRDVLILNSDTLVFGNWAERLRTGAYSDPRTATSNPFTNASHISSYPNRENKNHLPLEVDDEALDNLAQKHNEGRLQFVHTTVGFCMFIKRAALMSVGYFSKSYFPVGYGEESDFCYRARKIGWKHVIVGNVFVKHLENQSFGERKRALMQRMIDTFKMLHPEFEKLDRTFTHQDPLRRMRQRLDLARLQRLTEPSRSVRVGPYNTRKGVEPITLDIDFATGHSMFSLADQRTFPNLVCYKLPNDIVRFNSDLKFLGIDELVCSSPDDLERLTRLVSAKPYEIGLKPLLSVEIAQIS